MLRGIPGFIGIGAQKAGSNWLARYFESHPQVCFSPIKELHYFDCRFRSDLCGGFEKEFARRFQEVSEGIQSGEDLHSLQQARHLLGRLEMEGRPQAYRDFFSRLIDPAQHQVFGEITPSYSLLDARGFAEMGRLVGDPKIVLILRNPADRFWSQLRFTGEFRDLFRPLNEFESALNDPQYLLRTRYERTLSELFKAFDRASAAVIFYEDLFFGERREAEMQKITGLLGIDYREPEFDQRVAVSQEVELSPEIRKKAVERFASTYSEVRDFFGGYLPESWSKDLESI